MTGRTGAPRQAAAGNTRGRRPLAAAAAGRMLRAGDSVDSLGFLMADVVRLLRSDFAARTRDIPLTPALHRLLFYVKREPGCRQIELAQWLDVTPVTVGRMIDRLERQSLVSRESEPGDRRVSRVYIAAGAAELLEQLNARAQQTRDRAVRGMAPAERKRLLAALEHLRQNLLTDAPLSTAPRRASRVR